MACDGVNHTDCWTTCTLKAIGFVFLMYLVRVYLQPMITKMWNGEKSVSNVTESTEKSPNEESTADETKKEK